MWLATKYSVDKQNFFSIKYRPDFLCQKDHQILVFLRITEDAVGYDKISKSSKKGNGQCLRAGTV